MRFGRLQARIVACDGESATSHAATRRRSDNPSLSFPVSVIS
jgi:hypothetical protein